MKKKWLILLVCLLPFGQLYASTAEARLADVLTHFSNMTANFNQVIKDDDANVLQESSGSMAMQRPGKFRWDTHQPNRQLIIAVNDKLWIYDIDLEQITTQNMPEQSGSAPVVLLSDSVEKIKQFYSISSEPDRKKGVWFTLKPKKENDHFIWVKLYVVDNRLEIMQFKDNNEQLTRIRFSAIILDKPLKQPLFEMQIPKGVDFIDNYRA